VNKQLKDYEYYRTELGVLYKGDCLEILPLIKDKIDLVLTDPPYGININKSNRLSISRGFGNEGWDNKQVNIGILFTISENQIIFGGNYFDLKPTKCFYIWDKKNDNRDFADCEYIWTSFNKIARIHRQRPMNMDGGKQHPTQKPLKLITRLLMDLSKEYNLILDPFLGSGTTAIACEKLNRRWIGIEISEKYCEIAKQRIKNEYDKLKLIK